jgi:hypothetical protein
MALAIASACSLYDPYHGQDPYEGKAGPTKLSGSFVQPWFVSGWSEADWASEMTDLKAAGVDDHFIWQWTVDEDAKTAYYPTSLPGYKMVSDAGCADPVGASLAAAKAAGMKVWLGLNTSGDWWKKYAGDQTWLDAEFAAARSIAAELWSSYGAAYGGTIAGFYLPFEMDNNHFCGNAAEQDRMEAAYKGICDYVHDRMPGCKVMVAPYSMDLHWAWAGQEAWQAMWENILTTAAIDVISFQDGCGAFTLGSTHTSLSTVKSWFAATRKAIDDTRPATELWSDLETFDMDSSGCFCVKDFSRIKRQIEAESPYVDRFSSFAVMHDQTRVGVEAGSTAAAQYEELKSQQGGS